MAVLRVSVNVSEVKIGIPMWDVYGVFLHYIGSNRENWDKYYVLLRYNMKTGLTRSMYDILG